MGSKDIENELRLIETRFSASAVSVSVKPLHEAVEVASVSLPEPARLRKKLLDLDASLAVLRSQVSDLIEELKEE